MTNAKIANDVDAVTVEVEVVAPAERVFQALTDATQLLAWWGQEPSVELSLCEMDARPGGRWPRTPASRPTCAKSSLPSSSIYAWLACRAGAASWRR